MRHLTPFEELKAFTNHNWNEAEIECYKYKTGGGGCKACPIRRDYNIKPCYMFDFVRIRYTRYGKPKGV